MSQAKLKQAYDYPLGPRGTSWAYYTGRLLHHESGTVEVWLTGAPPEVLQDLEATHPGIYLIHNDAPRTRSAVVQLESAFCEGDELLALWAEGIKVVGLDVTPDGYMLVRVLGDLPRAQARLDEMYGSDVVRVEYGEPARAGEVIASFPERDVEVWEYERAGMHSSLLLRSPKGYDGSPPTNVDLIFQGVDSVSLPRRMFGVRVEEAGADDLGRLFASPAGKQARFAYLTGHLRVFVLVSDNSRHFVVAYNCFVREHEGNSSESFFKTWSDAGMESSTQASQPRR